MQRLPSMSNGSRTGSASFANGRRHFGISKTKPILNHHITWLAKGGEDANTVALCPNCHRKMHVVDRKIDRDTLKNRATERELDNPVSLLASESTSGLN